MAHTAPLYKIINIANANFCSHCSTLQNKKYSTHSALGLHLHFFKNFLGCHHRFAVSGCAIGTWVKFFPQGVGADGIWDAIGTWVKFLNHPQGVEADAIGCAKDVDDAPPPLK